MDVDICQACGGTGRQSDADSKKQPGRTLWMYHGPKGEGRLFKNMSQNALSNLEIEGWRDHPVEAIEASKMPPPAVEKDVVDTKEQEAAAEEKIKIEAEDMRQADARRKQEREEAEFQELLKQEKLAKQAKPKRVFARKGK